MKWGILGPGKVESTRRVRTLNLAATTRAFNEMAVPGLGGVWFGRQIFLAVLGVQVAQQARTRDSCATTIVVTNAIEALACWLALKHATQRDARVRGSEKLAGVETNDLTFGNASRPGFYVSQPMRMASVSALPALGMVETSGSRFNGFSSSPLGRDFIDAMVNDARPHKRNLVDYLVGWVTGNSIAGDTDALRRGLALQAPLPQKACELLEMALSQNTPGFPEWQCGRRRDALAWVRTRRNSPLPISWSQQPEEIRDKSHWQDLRAGAAFFLMRDAAFNVLDSLEQYIGHAQGRYSLQSEPEEPVGQAIDVLRDRASNFRTLNHSDAEASRFCSEMLASKPNALIRNLVMRDDRILRLERDAIRPGPAFQGIAVAEVSVSDIEEVTVSPEADGLDFPEGISSRVRNLWSLALDLDHGMDDWLHPRSTPSASETVR